MNICKSMRNLYLFNSITLKIFIVLSVLVVVLSSVNCKGKVGKETKGIEKVVASSEGVPGYVKYIAFQNSDSTWGFTVFVNSRPYLLYKQMPFPESGSGFQTRKDAEKIAGDFVKRIREGDLSPELDKATIDSLKHMIKKLR
jgi:hypothetical protein